VSEECTQQAIKDSENNKASGSTAGVASGPTQEHQKALRAPLVFSFEAASTQH
jgi:hypothetical protein